MYENAKTLRAQEKHSWTWNLVPLAVVSVALAGLLLPHGSADADTVAAEAAALEAASAAVVVLVPSPQPGEGEPALRAEDLPQSY